MARSPDERRKVLSTVDSEDRLASRREIANHLAEGRLDSARLMAESAVCANCDIRRPRTVECVSALMDLASVAWASDQPHDYLAIITRARKLTVETFGPNHPDVLFAEMCLADAHLALNDQIAAARHIEHALGGVDRLEMQGTLFHAKLLARQSALQLKHSPPTAERLAIEALVIYRRHRDELWPHGLQTLEHAYRKNGKAELAARISMKRQNHIEAWSQLLERTRHSG